MSNPSDCSVLNATWRRDSWAKPSSDVRRQANVMINRNGLCIRHPGISCDPRSRLYGLPRALAATGVVPRRMVVRLRTLRPSFMCRSRHETAGVRSNSKIWEFFMSAPFAILGIDHVVLRAADPAALERFYMEVLGCTLEKRQGKLTQLRAGRALIDIVPANEAGTPGGPALAGGAHPPPPWPGRRPVR